MHLFAKPIKLLEIHNQWRPLVGIMTFDKQIWMNVHALDSHFDQTDEATQFNVRGFHTVLFCKWMPP